MKGDTVRPKLARNIFLVVITGFDFPSVGSDFITLRLRVVLPHFQRGDHYIVGETEGHCSFRLKRC